MSGFDILQRLSLSGRRALVTGGGRGLGRSIAQGLAVMGAEVTLCARTENEIADGAAEIRAKGLKATYLVADVSDVADFAALIAEQSAFDIFVNNAGMNRPKPLSEVTEEDYDAVLGLNLRAAVFAAKAVSGRMMAEGRGGSIINMSSQMGHVGAANRAIYCASKWALEGFTKALAVELGPKAIRVNTVGPTFIETPMTAPFLADPNALEAIVSKIKLGRLGKPGDVVGAVAFLASDAAALVTGSAILVDGGWTAD